MENTQNAQDNQFTAIVVGTPSKVMPKENGKSFVLINVKATSGLFAGMTKPLPGSFTFEGELADSDYPGQGEEITVYHQMVPSTKNPGEMIDFFTISTGGGMSASMDEIAEFRKRALAQQTVAQGSI